MAGSLQTTRQDLGGKNQPRPSRQRSQVSFNLDSPVLLVSTRVHDYRQQWVHVEGEAVSRRLCYCLC